MKEKWFITNPYENESIFPCYCECKNGHKWKSTMRMKLNWFQKYFWVIWRSVNRVMDIKYCAECGESWQHATGRYLNEAEYF